MMKRIICLLICMSLCLTFALSETTTLTDSAILFAEDSVALMLKKAEENGVELWGNWRFSQLSPETVRKAAVITVSEDTLHMMEYMAPEGEAVLTFVAEYVNNQYSTDYAAASKALAVSGENAGLGNDRHLLVWLSYNYHSCLCLIRADGSWESALMMGDLQAVEAFSEDYIRGWMENFYIFNAEIEVVSSLPVRATMEHGALELTQSSVQKMKDKAAAEGIRLENLYWDISLIDPHAVQKAAVVRISDRSYMTMQYMAGEGNSIVEFVSNYANSQFSQDYTAGANALIQSGEDASVETNSTLLVLAVYEYHICVCIIRADGSWESGLMMSDRSVLNRFSEQYIKEILEQFFITDAEIKMIL